MAQSLASVLIHLIFSTKHREPLLTTEVEPELYAFLGSSLLADALSRHGVDIIIHGHAHKGFPQGRTASGIPVYNVCRFVQQRHTGRPYGIFTI